MVLHNQNKAKDPELVITNHAMRKLNHEHIFIYPYMAENGLDLDDILPGLSAISKQYKIDLELKEKIAILGEQYLADGYTLLHGDYFPGSWLKTSEGIRIIDPEFCFYGFPEFEIGVTIAHLMMADQPVETVFNAMKYYSAEAELDMARCKQFAGVEMLRRIMGLAQLPLKIDLDKRAQLLETAREYILN
jgi:5-methylthioribose kinase